MTTWWELGLAVVGWGVLCFGLFHLGRLWERDHPKELDPRFQAWLAEQSLLLDDAIEELRVRLGPYDQENEIAYGPHRRG